MVVYDEDLEFDYFFETAEGGYIFFCGLPRDALSIWEGTAKRRTHLYQTQLAQSWESSDKGCVNAQINRNVQTTGIEGWVYILAVLSEDMLMTFKLFRTGSTSPLLSFA